MNLKYLTAVAALVVAASSLNAAQNTAQVVTIHGAARYSTGNNVWLPLKEGAELKAGSVIQTASESWVDLALGGGGTYSEPQTVIKHFTYGGGTTDSQQNVVRLRENTVLAIDRLSFEQTGADTITDIGLDLRAGRVFGNVKKLSAASKYEVKLPNGVAGIRGTIFDLNASGFLSVFLGGVVISYFDGAGQLVTKVIAGGQELNLNTGVIKPISQTDIDDTIHQLPSTPTSGSPVPPPPDHPIPPSPTGDVPPPAPVIQPCVSCG
jgi:hypothetical protein